MNLRLDSPEKNSAFVDSLSIYICLLVFRLSGIGTDVSGCTGCGCVCLPVGILNNKRRMYRIQRLIRYLISGFQPRSQGSLLLALRSERERESLENAGHVAPEQN